MSSIIKSIVRKKEDINRSVYATFIAIARFNGDPEYQSFRDGTGLKKPFEGLLWVSGDNLANDGGFQELRHFQKYLSDYRINVFDGLKPIGLFSGNSLSAKKLIYYMIGTMSTTT